jgi:hypothetical protein
LAAKNGDREGELLLKKKNKKRKKKTRTRNFLASLGCPFKFTIPSTVDAVPRMAITKAGKNRDLISEP